MKKTTKATRKTVKKPAKSVRKPGKANTPAKVKTPPKAKETPKTAKVEKKPTFTPVTLPAHVKSANGMEVEITAKYIKLTHGLHEIIFTPSQIHFIREDVSEVNGQKLPYVVKAGSISLRRGDFCVTFAPEKTEAINAILTAREIVKRAKNAAKKGGAK